MKPLKMALKSVILGLRVVTREVEKIERLLDSLETEQGSAKPKATPAKSKKNSPKGKAIKKSPATKPKITATDAIMRVLSRSSRGLTTREIKVKTGFSDKKIWNAVNRLKREGKVKSERRGVYQKA